MKNCFNYMFLDSDFLIKILIYVSLLLIVAVTGNIAQSSVDLQGTLATSFSASAIASLLTPVLTSFLISVLISLVLSGYSISCIRACIEAKKQGQNPILPYINVFKDIKDGIKVYLGLLLLVPLVFLCYIPLFALFLLPSILAKAIIIIIGLGLLVFFALTNIMCFYIYANTGKITSFVRLIYAYKLIKRADVNKRFQKTINNYCLLFLFTVIASSIVVVFLCVCYAIFCNPSALTSGQAPKLPLMVVFISNLLFAFIQAYATFVNVHIVANCSDAAIEE